MQDIQRSSAAAERSGPAAHDSPDKHTAPPVVITPTMNSSPGGEQRVDRAVTTLVGDQRVDSSILPDYSPSLPPSAVHEDSVFLHITARTCSIGSWWR